MKIGCLNIGGNAKLKCQTPDIIDIISKHDLFAVMESWLDRDDSCPVVPMVMQISVVIERKSENRSVALEVSLSIVDPN